MARVINITVDMIRDLPMSLLVRAPGEWRPVAIETSLISNLAVVRGKNGPIATMTLTSDVLLETGKRREKVSA